MQFVICFHMRSTIIYHQCDILGAQPSLNLATPQSAPGSRNFKKPTVPNDRRKSLGSSELQISLSHTR